MINFVGAVLFYLTVQGQRKIRALAPEPNRASDGNFYFYWYQLVILAVESPMVWTICQSLAWHHLLRAIHQTAFHDRGYSLRTSNSGIQFCLERQAVQIEVTSAITYNSDELINCTWKKYEWLPWLTEVLVKCQLFLLVNGSRATTTGRLRRRFNNQLVSLKLLRRCFPSLCVSCSFKVRLDSSFWAGRLRCILERKRGASSNALVQYRI